MTKREDKYFTASFRYSPIDQSENIANKRRVIEIMEALSTVALDDLPGAAEDAYHADVALNVTHPINEISGIEAGLRDLWLPIRQALPDMERHNYLVAGGRYLDGNWIGCMGHYLGSF